MSYVGMFFNNRLSYEEFEGYAASGESLKAPIEIKARIEPSNKIINSLDQGEILSSTVIYTNHDVKRGSFITFQEDRLKVLSVRPNFKLNGEILYSEVYLG